jgi:hypothetical protein
VLIGRFGDTKFLMLLFAQMGFGDELQALPIAECRFLGVSG